jgi:uncharacterized protein
VLHHPLVDLEAHFSAHPELQTLRERVEPRLADDAGHDLTHALRVGKWTLRLDPDLEPRHALAAALLHDAVNLPKDHPERARASERSASLAREWLGELNFEIAEIDLIADAIEDHSYSRGATPRSALGRALQDADRLEALGAIGIIRTFVTGVRLGGRPFDSLDPFARSRELDDKAFSVDHFFVKLLGLVDTMQTNAGRDEARRRAAYMRGFLDQLGIELGSSTRELDAIP